MINNKPFNKWFQIRWKEPLGKPECPYLYRWTLILFNYSIRVHHWIRSDASTKYYHDHSCNFISIVLKGSYRNHHEDGTYTEVKSGSIWKSHAFTRHYLEIPKSGAWTLLLCGRPYHKWGFYVNGHKWRPKRFFAKFGHPPCDLQ